MLSRHFTCAKRAFEHCDGANEINCEYLFDFVAVELADTNFDRWDSKCEAAQIYCLTRTIVLRMAFVAAAENANIDLIQMCKFFSSQTLALAFEINLKTNNACEFNVSRRRRLGYFFFFLFFYFVFETNSSSLEMRWTTQGIKCLVCWRKKESKNWYCVPCARWKNMKSIFESQTERERCQNEIAAAYRMRWNGILQRIAHFLFSLLLCLLMACKKYYMRELRLSFCLHHSARPSMAAHVQTHHRRTRLEQATACVCVCVCAPRIFWGNHKQGKFNTIMSKLILARTDLMMDIEK